MVSTESRQDAVSEGTESASTPPALQRSIAQLEGPLTLRDGTMVHMRAIRADDADRLRAFHARLSADTIVFRFFRFLPQLSQKDAERFTRVDYDDRMALLATRGHDAAEEMLGVVRYERIGPATAEVAFVVEDHWQGHGIATALLYRLATYARAHGITTFVAITMATNLRMLEVLRNCGFPSTHRFIEGDVEVELDITKPPALPR
jgi:RimJ/RimL family protein N-acetyltransferase